jgi:hypothetical protein
MSSGITIVPTREAEQVRRFPNGHFELVTLAGQTLGHAVYRPGWRWSLHVGSRGGEQWCEVAHVGYVVAGQAGVRMRDGAEAVMAAGDWFNIPPGHDSWVIGDEDYESIHIVGATTYAASETGDTAAAGVQASPDD